jgi:hypothetical protein
VNLKLLLDGIGTANPAGTYGGWRGGLLKGALSTIAMYTRGVRNHTIVTPADHQATDYAFPNDSQIGLPGARATCWCGEDSRCRRGSSSKRSRA